LHACRRDIRIYRNLYAPWQAGQFRRAVLRRLRERRERGAHGHHRNPPKSKFED